MTDYSNVTFTMSLPRSRTAWLAETFAVGALTLHDPLKQCASIDELKARVDHERSKWHGPILVVDTAAVFFFNTIQDKFPGARFLFIRRLPADVVDSLLNAFVGEHLKNVSVMRFQNAIAKADQAYFLARTEVLPSGSVFKTVLFEDLSNLETLRQIWMFIRCHGSPAAGWFERMIATNVQVPFWAQAARTDRVKVTKLFAGFPWMHA